MEIKDADVAELVDARDLKFPAVHEDIQLSVKTAESEPAELASEPALLQNKKAKVWTYFIQGGGRIKIGRSKHPRGRMSDLQLGLPYKLKYLISVPETVISEWEAHQKFADLRVEGEWFRPEPALLEYIEELKKLRFKKSEQPRIRERYAPRLDDPTLEALSEHLRRIRPTLSKQARGFASNIIEQMKAVHTPADLARIRPFMQRQLQMLETIRN